MPKIAIAGKGGAGKTMVASTLAYLFAAAGETVYAIDADPNPTLGMALGFPQGTIDALVPIRSMRELIAERTGTGSGAVGTFFRLNPQVHDIPGQFSAVHRSIRLLVMGETPAVNAGCACAENTLVKALVNHMVLRARETVLLDMVAGTEHLGRGTVAGVDTILLVVEPAARSICAAQSVASLLNATASGSRCMLVANKITGTRDLQRVTDAFPTLAVAASLPWSAEVLAAENDGVPVYDRVPLVVEGLRNLAVQVAAAPAN